MSDYDQRFTSAIDEIERLRGLIDSAPHSYGCASVATECCKRCHMDPCSARCQADDYGGRGACNCWKSKVNNAT